MYDYDSEPTYRRFRRARFAWRGIVESRRDMYTLPVTLDHLIGRDAKAYLFGRRLVGGEVS